MDDKMTGQRLRITPQYLIGFLLVIVVVPFLPLLISQQWGWWQAWVYGLTCVLGFAISRALAARRHPDLLAERGRFLQQSDSKSWDKILAPIVGLGSGVLPLLAGLDARYGWSAPFQLWVTIAALVLLLTGYLLGSYALIENRFFSGMVRIQYERGHSLVSSGPYRWIRHPGYAGAWLAYVATPLLLESSWALIALFFLTIALIIRTDLEDRTLQAELAGYREYTSKVHYRLIPGIW